MTREIWGAWACVTFAIGLVSIAHCAASKTAADEYDAQLKACNVVFSAPVDRLSCIHDVEAKWTEAGAPAAIVPDGGGK